MYSRVSRNTPTIFSSTHTFHIVSRHAVNVHTYVDVRTHIYISYSHLLTGDAALLCAVCIHLDQLSAVYFILLRKEKPPIWTFPINFPEFSSHRWSMMDREYSGFPESPKVLKLEDVGSAVLLCCWPQPRGHSQIFKDMFFFLCEIPLASQFLLLHFLLISSHFVIFVREVDAIPTATICRTLLFAWRGVLDWWELPSTQNNAFSGEGGFSHTSFKRNRCWKNQLQDGLPRLPHTSSSSRGIRLPVGHQWRGGIERFCLATSMWNELGGGFKYFLFSSLFGEDSNLD